MKRFLLLICLFNVFCINNLFALDKKDEDLIRRIIRDELKNGGYIEKEIDSQMKRKFIPQITNTINNQNSNNNTSNINTKVYIDYNQVNFFKIFVGGNKHSVKYFDGADNYSMIFGFMWKHRIAHTDWFFDLNLMYDVNNFKSDEYFTTTKSPFEGNMGPDYSITFKPKYNIISPLELNIGQFITDNLLISAGINFYIVTLDMIDALEHSYGYDRDRGKISEAYDSYMPGFNVALEYNFNRRIGLRAQYKYIKYDDFGIFKSYDLKDNIFALQLLFAL